MKKYFASLLLTFLLLQTALYSIENRPCDTLKSELQKNEIPFSIQILSNVNDDSFPYSLIVSKPAKDKSVTETMLVIIPETTAIKMQDEVIEFCKKLMETETDYNIEVLLSANDYSKIPQSEVKRGVSGTMTYIEQCNFDTELFALIISDELSDEKISDEKTLISYACKKKATPPLFLRDVIISLFSAKIPFRINPSAIGYIRMGATKDNPIMEYLFQNEIPAIHLQARNNILDSVLYYIQHFGYVSNQNWDSQYYNLTIFRRPLFLPSWLLVIILSAQVFISLFLTCFSILFGTAKLSRKNDLKRTFYIPFVLIFLMFISLEIGQGITLLIFPNWANYPAVSLFIKICLAISFFMIPAGCRFFLTLPQTSYIYGFLLNVICVINTLIFSLYDLSFLIFFTAIFIVANISRIAYKKIGQIICFILNFLLLIPLVNMDFSTLRQVCNFQFNSSAGNNFLMAMFFCPYILFVIRFCVTIGRFPNHKLSEIKVFYKQTIIEAIIFVSLVICFLAAGLLVKGFGKESQQVKIISDNTDEFVNINLNWEINDEEKEVFLELNAKKEIMSYVIKVTSNSLLPVYDSNYVFDPFSEKNKAVFYFEEFPPENLNLYFSTNKDKDIQIEVISYCEGENNTIVKNSSIKTIKRLSENAGSEQ